MARHILMAFGNALNDLDDQFNHWYNSIHLADVLKIPGFVAAQRFEASSTQLMEAPYKFFAQYEIETEDLQTTIDELASKTPEELPVTEVWDYDRCATYIYTPITGVVREETPSTTKDLGE